MPVAKSLALATALILELMTWVGAAPISQSGYSRPVPKQERRSRTSTDPVVGEASEDATDM
jgi:hypothetical protein